MELREAGQHIVVALDELSYEASLDLLGALRGRPYAFKLHHIVDGLGPTVVEECKKRGAGRVWVDYKLVDIPSTVRKRVRALTMVGANFITVMAASEVDAMMEAVSARAGSLKEAADTGTLESALTVADAEHGPGIIAVTVLTSLSEEQAHLLHGQPVKAAVLYQARLAKLAGIRHLVCSPHELEMLIKRPELKDLDFFVPGIRPAGKAAGDQQRFDTPTAAIKAAKKRVKLVIGRAITEAPDPVAAFDAIAEEIAAVRAI